jgi:hypothetical protein
MLLINNADNIDLNSGEYASSVVEQALKRLQAAIFAHHHITRSRARKCRTKVPSDSPVFASCKQDFGSTNEFAVRFPKSDLLLYFSNRNLVLISSRPILKHMFHLVHGFTSKVRD